MEEVLLFVQGCLVEEVLLFVQDCLVEDVLLFVQGCLVEEFAMVPVTFSDICNPDQTFRFFSSNNIVFSNMYF